MEWFRANYVKLTKLSGKRHLIIIIMCRIDKTQHKYNNLVYSVGYALASHSIPHGTLLSSD